MDWNTIASDVSKFVTAAAPVVDAAVAVLAPEAAASVAIGEKIIQGLIAEEPAAVALYNQIVGGTPATAAQVQQINASYEADYQQAKADIAAALAKLPPA